ncbi:hypothetical protein BKA67DRAFT_663838 [Truncatella angustata]|uniref:Ecp2 effector protein-like domain-containing protein n=1 Tax=Truncatella angustata TaxID=152316 RepID=A0A9P8U969_9PEZI|nr:uncharacterized protein BKA67DRAFT_663838 [Truncatella angustata]KAH6645964.1 hypothetical protein BKA67DRAFT_663838 [Truncatella angustata]KAH8205509.1 hypothetical protein TruAng_000415 [Truncatella angustata]
MYLPSTTLLAAMLQLAALCSATPLAHPPRASSGPACTYISSVGAISCPGGCCGWALAGSTTPFCDAGGASSLAIASRPGNWLESCGALGAATRDANRNYVLTEFQQGVWHALVENDGCRFEVNIADPEDSGDPIHVAAGDVETFLGQGIEQSQGGSSGATGSTRCYGYGLQWRVVPPGN